MKKKIIVLIVLSVIAGLGVWLWGRGKVEKSEPKPESVLQPVQHSAQDGNDHSGHNH